MALEVLAINSASLVRLDGFTRASTGAYINNGRYEGTIGHTVSLTLNAFYTLQITAVAGGFQIYRQCQCIAKYRSTQ